MSFSNHQAIIATFPPLTVFKSLWHPQSTQMKKSSDLCSSLDKVPYSVSPTEIKTSFTIASVKSAHSISDNAVQASKPPACSIISALAFSKMAASSSVDFSDKTCSPSSTHIAANFNQTSKSSRSF